MESDYSVDSGAERLVREMRAARMRAHWIALAVLAVPAAILAAVVGLHDTSSSFFDLSAGLALGVGIGFGFYAVVTTVAALVVPGGPRRAYLVHGVALLVFVVLPAASVLLSLPR